MPGRVIYLKQLFRIGRDGKSLAMIFPSAVLKSIHFDPETMFFILKVAGPTSLHLKVVNEKNIVNETKLIIPDLNTKIIIDETF